MPILSKKEPELAIPKPDSKKEKRQKAILLKNQKRTTKLQVHLLDNFICQNPWHGVWIKQFIKFVRPLPRPTNNLEAAHLIRRSQGGKWNIYDCISFCGCCNYWSDEGLDHPLHGRITGRQFKIHVLIDKQRNDKDFRHKEVLELLVSQEAEPLKELKQRYG